jgi:predicted phage terminase large subunit-like protein
MTSLSPVSESLTPQSALSLLQEKERLAKALLQRQQTRAARQSLLAFTSYTKPNYQAAAHHKLIAEKLEAVQRGDIDRLMVFMPPRHGKSELVSVRYPAWWLGLRPSDQIITASYAHKLAAKFGRQVRNLIKDKRCQQVFPGLALSEDSEAKDLFNTNAEGVYMATGVDGSVTGSGANLAIIDDPVKGRKEAESETMREAAWDWYQGDLYTRLMPGAAIVVCQTRWHEDDLSGRILEREGRKEEGGEWEVLELPALHPERGALWPEWYDEEALERIRKAVGPRDFSALYQQQPQPDEGTFFKREWFTPYEKLPANLRYYGTSDYAVTDGGGDYTVLTIWGIGPNGDIYRAAQWKGQTASDEWIEAQLDLVKRYKPLAFFGEGGVIQKAVEPMLKRRMRERNTHCRLEWLPSVADKPTRARSFQAMAATGRVHFEPDADLSEFLVFPAGKHDDEVDTASLIGRAIDQAHPAIVQAQEKERRRDGYWPEEQSDNDWMTV